MIDENLKKLRKIMKTQGIDVYILPGTDPHQNEYLHESFNRRKFISGFTGSYGNIVITQKEALIWTDGRYELQVANETKDSSFKFFIKDMSSAPLELEANWIVANCPKKVVAVDAQLLNIKQAEMIEEKFSNKKIKIKYLSENIIDKVWEKRPALPKSMASFRTEEYESVSSKEKIDTIKEYLKTNKIDYLVISNLESIARILNVRGSDMENNLLLTSYLIIGQKDSYWFIESEKLPKKYQSYLPNKNFKVLAYKDIRSKLAELSKGKAVLIDPNETTKWIKDSIDKKAKIIYDLSPANKIKAIKTSFELNKMRNAYRKEGVALLKLVKWIKDELKERSISEYEVAEKVLEFRKEEANFISLSFDSIVAYNENGAIIHYKPEKKKCIDLKNEGSVLIDTGAHYFEGTTDITRTIRLGKVSEDLIDKYTKVLKGHIALSRIHFPKGTKACSLDILARQFLWNNNLDYNHGTGHGIGYTTCVHETAGIRMSIASQTVLEKGMTFSNEPGYYLPGSFGIRIENIVAVDEENNFLKFKTLSLFPYDRDLIDFNQLNTDEKNWINQYHSTILEELSPIIRDTNLLNYLEDMCSLI